MEYAIYASLLLFGLVAILLNIFSVPGNWLLLLAALGVSGYSGWAAPTPAWLLIMLFVLLFGELFELLAGMFGARRFGASRTAAIVAIPGGIGGALLGLLIPIPVAGSIIGAVFGCAIAVFVFEMMRARTVSHSLKAALGAGMGRVMGLFGKMATGLAVWVMLIFVAWP
jgi:uncharacterized protein YqgC (DUF456 family)